MESDKRYDNLIMQKEKFLGIDCLKVNFGDLNLLITLSVGPRIISLKYKNSGNIFAELPNDFLEYSKNRKFFFYGGHRLWVAPEDPAITYLPDDQSIQVNTQSDYVELIQNMDSTTGLKKIIYIRQTEYKDCLIIDHLIKNEGDSERKIAPWAITQLKLGGTAILPFKSTSKENPLLPDRSLFLWPYTNIHDTRIEINGEYIIIHSIPENEKPLKIGINNMQKWIAYFFDRYLFIKYSNKVDWDCSLDLGAEAQCYCNHKFLELETLGLYKNVKPGETIEHREIWRMVEDPFDLPTPKTLLDFGKSDEMGKKCLEML